MPKKVPDTLSAELTQELVALGQQEFQAVSGRKNDARTLMLAREMAYAEFLSRRLERLFSRGVPKPLVAKKPPKGKSLKRVLHLVISDTHFGSNPDPRETRHVYSPVEEARRLTKVLHQAITYKTEHRDNTKLMLHVLGDIQQGQLHDPRDGVPLAEQTADSIHLLAQAVRWASEEFPEVDVAFQPGNHGRYKSRHIERATFQKWDANETVIYYAVKKIAQMAGWKNVRFALPYTPYYLIDVLGHGIFGTHGDTVLKPGNPHKTIDVGSITSQVNNIIVAEAALSPIKPAVFIMGHVHLGTTVELANNITAVTNGCLLPPDPYAMSIGAFSSNCGQQMFETTEDFAFGDHRYIRVNSHTDKDASLDGPIVPFTGLDS